MLEANESLENIFESAVKEAEKRKHEYVTIEHILVALLKDKDVGQILHDFKVNVCLLYTSPSPRDATLSRMPSSA